MAVAAVEVLDLLPPPHRHPLQFPSGIPAITTVQGSHPRHVSRGHLLSSGQYIQQTHTHTQQGATWLHKPTPHWPAVSLMIFTMGSHIMTDICIQQAAQKQQTLLEYRCSMEDIILLHRPTWCVYMHESCMKPWVGSHGHGYASIAMSYSNSSHFHLECSSLDTLSYTLRANYC